MNQQLQTQAGPTRRWLCAVYVACLLGLVAAGGAAWRTWHHERRGIERPTHTAVERQMGVNVELSQYDADALERALSDIASLGFHWVRQRFPWQAIEPQSGAYRWDPWDALVQAVHDHGLGLIAILDTPPEWARTGSSQGGQEPVPLPCVPPYDPIAYARFASAFAGRYGAIIDHYQVWDEPNLSRSWGGGHVAPCGYAVLLESAYPAIHAADPTAWVLGGGLAPTQAPGPDNLSDLTYLRQLYAAGGGPSLDILAVKPYGFWSGPQDRRVADDVLNFSRAIALREWMRARGDGDKPLWAIEWGWNVLPDGWEGPPPPWGSDRPSVQRPRILGALRRARAEWPWMGVMCWASYQPDIPPTDPRWGFALRFDDGSPTPLYNVLRAAEEGLPTAPTHPVPVSASWKLLLLLPVGVLDAALLWPRFKSLRQGLWRWWRSLPPPWHLLGLLALSALYAFTPWPEWVGIELVLAALILYEHPQWALIGAVWSIPLFYAAKPIGTLLIPPSETLLLLALIVLGVRHWRAKAWPVPKRPVGQGRVLTYALGLMWMAWVAWGALSPPFAPDPPLAWREWRLCMLDPALLYWLLRLYARMDLPSEDRHSAAARDERSSQKTPCSGSPFARRGPQSAPLGRRIVIRRKQDREWNIAQVSRRNHGQRAHRFAFEGTPTGPASPHWLYLAWVLSGVTVALVGIGQAATGMLIPAGNVGRVTGVYYSPNHLALYMERIWPLVLALALGAELRRRWRFAAWGAAVAIGVALYLTYSRGAWLLGIPIALLIVGWAYRRRLRWWMIAGGTAVLLLAMVSILIGRDAPASAQIRAVVWQSTLEIIADHPWIGAGLDGFRFVYPRYMRAAAWTEPLLYHPHNMWLDAAVRLGIPGLVLFGALIAGSLSRVARLGKRPSPLQKAVSIGLQASLGAALAHGMVDSGYFLPDLAWGLALVAGLARFHLGSRPTDLLPS